MPRDRATLQSVAERAQVSRQTVSNVLNAPHRVHPTTLDRVRGAIDALDYRPHQGARSLRTRRSHLLGLRLDPFRDGVNGSVLDRFLHALTEAAELRGYRLLLFTATDDAAEVAAYDDVLGQYEVDAFVLTSTHHGDRRTAWLAERGLPFVTFGRPWDAESGGRTARHSWVDVDGAAGTSAVTAQLVAQGHRRVAFLGWPSGSGVGDDRRGGWEQAMAASGAEVTGLAAEVQDGFEHGRTACAELLAGDAPPTAFLCVSDSLASGALSALAQHGIEPGPELPVVGFDDTPVARAVGLTSFAQPLGAVAAECVRLVTALVEPGEDAPEQPAHVLLPPHLVVRSTGPSAPSDAAVPDAPISRSPDPA